MAGCQFPAQFARASLKRQGVRHLQDCFAEFPAQFARASLKPQPKPPTPSASWRISRAICAGLIEALRVTA